MSVFNPYVSGDPAKNNSHGSISDAEPVPDNLSMELALVSSLLLLSVPLVLSVMLLLVWYHWQSPKTTFFRMMSVFATRQGGQQSVLQCLTEEDACWFFGENALAILCLADPEKQYEIVMVGGAPRDTYILGQRPNDIDFITDMPKSNLKNCLEKVGNATMTQTGENMYTVKFPKDPMSYDIKIIVSPKKLTEDPETRDLGINTLRVKYNQENQENQYLIVDPTGKATKDIEKCLISFMPSALEWDKDCVRVFRLARFSAKFHTVGYTPDDNSRSMCCCDSVGNAIKNLDPQKLQNELDKLKQLNPTEYLIAMQLLLEMGILPHMFGSPDTGNSTEFLHNLITVILTTLPALQIPTSVLEPFLLAVYLHGSNNLTLKAYPKKLQAKMALYRLLLQIKTLEDGAQYMDKICKADSFDELHFLIPLLQKQMGLQFPTKTKAKDERQKFLHSLFGIIRKPLTHDERRTLRERIQELKNKSQETVQAVKTEFFVGILEERGSQ